MDPTKKRKQPESAFNPAVHNWRPELTRRDRLNYRNAIAERIVQNPQAIATMVEEGFYKEATSQHDYLTSVRDYIQSIPRRPGILQAVPVDLTSQMGHLDNSQVISDAIWPETPIFPPQQQQQPLAGLNTDGNTILPPQQQLQQQQPVAGPLSDGNTTLPPQQQPQQPQQQQSGSNEQRMEIQDELQSLLNL